MYELFAILDGVNSGGESDVSILSILSDSDTVMLHLKGAIPWKIMMK